MSVKYWCTDDTVMCVFSRFADIFGARAALSLSCLASVIYYLMLAAADSALLLFLHKLPAVFMHALPGQTFYSNYIHTYIMCSSSCIKYLLPFSTLDWFLTQCNNCVFLFRIPNGCHRPVWEQQASRCPGKAWPLFWYWHDHRVIIRRHLEHTLWVFLDKLYINITSIVHFIRNTCSSVQLIN